MINNFTPTKLVLNPPYVDEKVMDEFKKYMGDDGDSMEKELITLYLTNTPKAINLIGQDMKTGDIESLKAHVHSLKGSSAQLGVTGIATLCRNIEDAILEGKFVEIEPIFDRLEEIYPQVESIFKNKL